MTPKVIAYYTNADYAKLAANLSTSCLEFGINHSLTDHDGAELTWKQAVMFKPQFILDQLMQSDEDIFYTDADSKFVRKPDWSIFEGCDLAFHKFQRSIHHGVEYLTGTMFFRNTALVRCFVSDWVGHTEHWDHSDTPEQDSLRATVALWESRLKVVDMPKEWCFIHDDMREMYPDAQPIIEHYQASRTLNKDFLKSIKGRNI